MAPRRTNSPSLRRAARIALLLALPTALVGCAGLPAAQEQARVAAPPPDLRITRVLAEEGLQRLRQHQYAEASRLFNAGLKFAPDHAQLHFLNGLTYHLLYRRGDESAAELAVTGYEMALSLEPAHFSAAVQLGRLAYEARRYTAAVDAFQRAADIEPRSSEAHLGLARAAYYAQDLGTARRALAKLAEGADGGPGAAQAEAMVYAALGEAAPARAAALRHAALEPDDLARTHLERRVEQWGAWHAALGPAGAEALATSVQRPVLVAQATPSAAPAGATAPGPASREPAMPRWFDCDPAGLAAASAQGPAAAVGSGSADETAPLPALPSSCKGAGNPRMAILDVVIVRTEDTATTSFGVNLLDGLSYVLGRSRQLSDVLTRAASAPDTRTVTITRQRSDALGNSGSNPASITYSLNIANATNSRSEVLAQPSLVALDRQPSTFFSGRTITLGIAGQAGGASTFADKPVGVSLSVTPTFISDDTMLVAARAARSFVEQVDGNVGFVQTMQASRNSVSANVVLRFGQTLILSGLAEQEVQRDTDGVPVLQDIPVLQYLFRNKATQNFTRSVLVLITPHVPEPERARVAQAPAAASAAIRHAQDNKLFLQFRTGDLKAEDWSSPSRLDRILRQAGQMLYF